jgi:hypothetical protein
MILASKRRAAEEFNRAAINRGLSKVGESLPKGVKAGNEAVETAARIIGDKYDDLTYNDILVTACAKAGILAFTGDGETIEATVHAVGWNDDPAKAKGAAHTYALKYYLFEKFTVDQGEDDPDNSDFGAQGKGSGAGGRQQATQGRQGQSSGRLSDAQLARLYKKAEAAGMTKERTNARIVEKYKKQDPATLTRQEYDEICTSLDNAAAQHNQQGGNA